MKVKKILIALMLMAFAFIVSGCSIQVMEPVSYNKETKELLIPVSIKTTVDNATAAKVYYTRDAAQRSELEDYEKVNAFDNWSVTEIITDSGTRIKFDKKITIEEYKAHGGEVSQSTEDEYLINPIFIVPSVRLADGETIYYRLCVNTEIFNVSSISPVYQYTFIDPTLVNHPETGDTSDMLKYILLLSVSMLALCSIGLCRRKA